MYDDHYNQVCEQDTIPYLSMYEYLEQIYEHTENHGLFDRHTYDEYLSNEAQQSWSQAPRALSAPTSSCAFAASLLAEPWSVSTT